MVMPDKFDEENRKYRNQKMQQCGCFCHNDDGMISTHIQACCDYSGMKIIK